MAQPLFRNVHEIINLEATNMPLTPSAASEAVRPIKPVLDPTLKYYSTTRYMHRGNFVEPEYNLADVGRLEDTDSYVRQAFDKKVALMFKEGYAIAGRNDQVVKYVEARLEQISQASGIPFEKFMRDLGSALVRKNNAIFLKVRKLKASGGSRRKLLTGTIVDPVAGYFTIAPETMRPKLIKGKIVAWKQIMPDGTESDEMQPIDVVHIPYQVKDGFLFATPGIIPVIDDLRALRKLEENTELLVYQHLFPLLHYVVGTKDRPATIGPDGVDEIDRAREQIELMPAEGGIVTSERHEIKLIGAEGRALRVETYIEHWKKRVFAGLGVSAVDFGEGETANRATSDNMSRNLVDSVKDIQKVLALYINKFVIDELLAESTFGAEVFKPEHRCQLIFKEIDIDAQVKKENHNADLFTKNVLGLNETRARIGAEPILLPTPDEVSLGKDTRELYPVWTQLAWKLFELPQFLIQSLDEPWTPEAKKATNSRSKQLLAGVQAKQAAGGGATSSPPPQVPGVINNQSSVFNDFLVAPYESLTEYIVQLVKDKYSNVHGASLARFEMDWFAEITRTTMKRVQDQAVSELTRQFETSYFSHRPSQDPSFLKHRHTVKEEFTKRVGISIDKLVDTLKEALHRQIVSMPMDSIDASNVANMVRSTFQSFTYRMKALESTEFSKAVNAGMVFAKLDSNEVREWSSTCKNNQCLVCNEQCKYQLDIEDVTMDMIPPFHPNCVCELKANTMTAQNAAEIERPDGEKMDRCVDGVKASLRKRYPRWSQQKVESSAFAICTSRLKE